MVEASKHYAGYLPIADYAIIGDCETVALISTVGTIDWYCPGRFDGPAVFCRLLDAQKGGYLGVAPTGTHVVSRRYRGPTNVLETTFTTAHGTARVTDLMPKVSPLVDDSTGTSSASTTQGRIILRLVEGLGGTVDMQLHFKPTFDYARGTTEAEPSANGAVAHQGARQLTLSCPGITLRPTDDGSLRGRFSLKAGERHWIGLIASDGAGSGEAPTPAECDDLLARTLAYWEHWAAACTYRGPYRSKVLRSVLALKLLTYEPTGAIVAAPTASLPEEIGGVRNWDYRFSWLRDSSFTIYSFMTIGYPKEASAFYQWLKRTVTADPTGDPQILYGIDGRTDVGEFELPHLEGYRGSRPVRIGNGAAKQRQLDVYGETLAAIYNFRMRWGESVGWTEDQLKREEWPFVRSLVNKAAQRWQEPDSGIWEVRGEILQPFLYSAVMCWVALEDGIRLAQEYSFPAPVAEWARASVEIRKAILERGYNPELGSFTQSLGSKALDASALAIPLLGFLPATDPRVRSTVERIRADLTHDGLAYRYRTEEASDGLAGSEATFAFCTFWLINALAMGGQLDDAYDLFEQVTGYCNDVGLLAEEIDPSSRMLLGNFPQGFSHIGLINSAVTLKTAAKYGVEEQAEMPAERAVKAQQAASETYLGAPMVSSILKESLPVSIKQAMARKRKRSS